MTYISVSGSYVRKSEFADRRAAEVRCGSAIDERVWKLLETPHTIESLRRTVGPGTDRRQIESTIEQLLDADVIELSPDT